MTNNNTKQSTKPVGANCLLLHLQPKRSHYLKIAIYSLYALLAFLIQLSLPASAFAAAAATLNFDQGITDGVNPLLKLVLTHNGKAIFLSSAVGMLIGGGNNDGWTRLKMGGLWAIGAAALIHIMKGTLGVQMPG